MIAHHRRFDSSSVSLRFLRKEERSRKRNSQPRMNLRLSVNKLVLLLVMLATLRTALSAPLRPVEGCTLSSSQGDTLTFRCRDDVHVRLQLITPTMLRVRVSASGEFPESLPERWGLVKAQWPAFPIKTNAAKDIVSIETSTLNVRIDLKSFGLTITDHNGRIIFKQTALEFGDSSALRMDMASDEHFYGLGFQRIALDVRGHKLDWWREMRWKEATVPFFMSTRGYGFYSNNTWRHSFDFTGNDDYSVSARGGEPDYFVIYGPSLKTILDHYTDLTGKPLMVPRWALGVGYEARYLDEQKRIQAIGEGFRHEDIPLDWIGLEPGWEDVPYSMNWVWSPKRFPDPEGMIKSLAQWESRWAFGNRERLPLPVIPIPKLRKKWYSPRIDGATQ